MTTIDRQTCWAVANTLLCKLSNGKTIEATFKELGVTSKQWRKYQQSGVRLKVRPEVAARFKLIASFQPEGSDMKLLPVLLKMLEAGEGKK